MKHIFVETNFLVDLLRPFPSPEALALYARNDGTSVRLYVPWCSQAEASRTMTTIIKADLGFTDAMMKFALGRWRVDRTLFDKAEIEKVKAIAERDRREALDTIDQRIRDHVARMTRIDPSPAVVARTIQLFAVKALKPFDEMVLGAVLTKASELYGAGERDLTFCELDRDLASKHPPLVNEYARCGLNVVQGFDVP